VAVITVVVVAAVPGVAVLILAAERVVPVLVVAVAQCHSLPFKEARRYLVHTPCNVPCDQAQPNVQLHSTL
jgi:hypothetical protein